LLLLRHQDERLQVARVVDEVPPIGAQRAAADLPLHTVLVLEHGPTGKPVPRVLALVDCDREAAIMLLSR
jgi:hypothetical protein